MNLFTIQEERRIQFPHRILLSPDHTEYSGAEAERISLKRAQAADQILKIVKDDKRTKEDVSHLFADAATLQKWEWCGYLNGPKPIPLHTPLTAADFAPGSSEVCEAQPAVSISKISQLLLRYSSLLF